MSPQVSPPSQRNGRGAVVRVSQRDNLIGLVGEAVRDWSLNRRLTPHGCCPCLPLPAAEARPGRTFNGAAETAIDRWVTIAEATDARWRPLCAIIGRLELADALHCAAALDRYARQVELAQLRDSRTTRRGDDQVQAARASPATPHRRRRRWRA